MDPIAILQTAYSHATSTSGACCLLHALRYLRTAHSVKPIGLTWSSAPYRLLVAVN